MKPILTILILCAILLQSLSKTVLLLDYEVRKEYIQEKLCANRSKPEMKCHGKCYLKKQLKQEEEKQDQPSGSSLEEKNDIQLFCQPVYALAIESGKNDLYTDNWQNHYSYLFVTGITHPPSRV